MSGFPRRGPLGGRGRCVLPAERHAGEGLEPRLVLRIGDGRGELEVEMGPRGVTGGAHEADRSARGERGAGDDARLQIAEVAVDVLCASVELDLEADPAASIAVRVGVDDH